MAGGNIDLDRSLDDIIKTKKPRSTKPGKNISSRSSSGRGGSSGRGRGNARHNINIEAKTYVSSSPIHRNSNGHGGGRGSAAAINRRIGDTNDKSASQNINTRLSRTGGGAITKHGEGPAIKRGKGGNIITTTQKKQHAFKVEDDSRGGDQQRQGATIDPKTLVITKSISPRVAKVKKTPSGESLVIQSSVSRQQQPQPQQQQQAQPHLQQPQQQRQPQQSYHQPAQNTYSGGAGGGYQQQQHQSNVPYSNDSSYQQQPAHQNNSGAQKNIVLICNLDPRATAEDVGEACSMFGPILSCDILLDAMGRPLNEAEIEFLYPNSAEECVAKLDNGMADGRVLRARLQTNATLPVVPRYSSRTVIASARVAQGGFDNNSQHSNMHPQYNHNSNSRNHYNNNPSSYSHHQQRESHQYQRRY